jgi:UDP-N-acetylglucosamine 2-epimerase (non-hydrolysing)
MKTIMHVVGARPNFMKIAPIIEGLNSRKSSRQILINTGQHYDESMAGSFFRDLDLPRPDRDLGVGSASHAVQTGRIMAAFEEACVEYRPDLVVVVGDVNSTVAATLVAAKLVIPVAHVEAGLRSRDRTMPEEINRIVTDRLADVLLTPSRDADKNLTDEGIPRDRIHLVGNVMIDTVFKYLPLASLDRIQDRIAVQERDYALVTLHRPSNVDDPKTLRQLLDVMNAIAVTMPVVFPVHPRTRARLANIEFRSNGRGVILTQPLGYVDFLSLTSHARIVLTDSGGLQEEATALGIPCLTLRENTERPITVTDGTNRVVGTDPQRVLAAFGECVEHPPPRKCPELWDGRAAGRIIGVLEQFLRRST